MRRFELNVFYLEFRDVFMFAERLNVNTFKAIIATDSGFLYQNMIKLIKSNQNETKGHNRFHLSMSKKPVPEPPSAELFCRTLQSFHGFVWSTLVASVC